MEFDILGEREPHVHFHRKRLNGIAAWLKILAGLNIAERRSRQAGKVSFGEQFSLKEDLWVEIIPNGNFENIHLRIGASNFGPTPASDDAWSGPIRNIVNVDAMHELDDCFDLEYLDSRIKVLDALYKKWCQIDNARSRGKR